MTNTTVSFISMLSKHLGLTPESTKTLQDAFIESAYASALSSAGENSLQGWALIDEIIQRRIEGQPRWCARVTLYCGTENSNCTTTRTQEIDLVVAPKVEPVIAALCESAGARPFGEERVFVTIRNAYSSAYSGLKSVFTDSRGVLEAIHIA